MFERFAMHAPLAEVIPHFGLHECAEFKPRYNIAPGSDIPVVRRLAEGKRVLDLMKWGLVPHWAPNPDVGNKFVNARGETVAIKPAFREAYQRRRCLVPASGFYAWKADGHTRLPFYFSLRSRQPLALAGIWEAWGATAGTPLRTVCLITTWANALMASIHDRMPVILSPDKWDAWLDDPATKNHNLIAPYAGDDLQAWPVDRRVNNVAEDGVFCVACPAVF